MILFKVQLRIGHPVVAKDPGGKERERMLFNNLISPGQRWPIYLSPWAQTRPRVASVARGQSDCQGSRRPGLRSGSIPETASACFLGPIRIGYTILDTPFLRQGHEETSSRASIRNSPDFTITGLAPLHGVLRRRAVVCVGERR